MCHGRLHGLREIFSWFLLMTNPSMIWMVILAFDHELRPMAQNPTIYLDSFNIILCNNALLLISMPALITGSSNLPKTAKKTSLGQGIGIVWTSHFSLYMHRKPRKYSCKWNVSELPHTYSPIHTFSVVPIRGMQPSYILTSVAPAQWSPGSGHSSTLLVKG